MKEIKVKEVKRDVKVAGAKVVRHIKKNVVTEKRDEVEQPERYAQGKVERSVRKTVRYTGKKSSELLKRSKAKAIIEKKDDDGRRDVKGKNESSVKQASKDIKTAGSSGTKVVGRQKMFLRRSEKVHAQQSVVMKRKKDSAAKKAVVAARGIMRSIMQAISGQKVILVVGAVFMAIIVIVVSLIASVIGSVLGIFMSSSPDGEGLRSMSSAIVEINGEFADEIDSIISQVPHDEVVISNRGNTNLASNWRDVLAVYTVKVAVDPDDPTEVATLDDEKMRILRRVFWDMNIITYSARSVKDESITDGEVDEDSEKTILTISVRTISVDDMRVVYGFDDIQNEQLDELIKPEYASLFDEITGSYANLSLSSEELAILMENLSDDLDPQRKVAVTAAYSLVGKVPYFWGGKSLVIGWDSRWGVMTKVTSSGSPTTGTIRPLGMDCSGYIVWIFCQVGGEGNQKQIVEVVRHGGGYQYHAGIKKSWEEALPGDIVAFRDMSHVGIVIGKKENGHLLIAHCSSSRNNIVVDEYSGPRSGGFELVSSPRVYETD